MTKKNLTDPSIDAYSIFLEDIKREIRLVHDINEMRRERGQIPLSEDEIGEQIKNHIHKKIADSNWPPPRDSEVVEKYFKLYSQKGNNDKKIKELELRLKMDAPPSEVESHDRQVNELNRKNEAIDRELDNLEASLKDIDSCETIIERSERNDLMAYEIDAALQVLGPNAQPKKVMGELKKNIGDENSCIVSLDPKTHGVVWIDNAGAEKVLDLKKLQQRLSKKRKKHSPNSSLRIYKTL